MTPALVVLRPEPGAGMTARRARDAGWNTIALPLFEIAPLDWAAPDPEGFDAILMTSANSARIGGEALAAYRHLPLYAVGAQTADAARAIGFGHIVEGKGGAAEMADRLRADGQRRIFHPAGEATRPFDETGLSITRCALYSAQPVPEPDLASLPDAAIFLLHSPRAAQYLDTLCTTQSIDRAHMAIVAISAAALANAGTGWRRAIAAQQPNDTAMFAAASSLADLR